MRERAAHRMPRWMIQIRLRIEQLPEDRDGTPVYCTFCRLRVVDHLFGRGKTKGYRLRSGGIGGLDIGKC